MNYVLENIKNFFINFNYIDLIVLVSITAYAFEGYSVGFLFGVLDVLTFILSLFLSLRFYSFVSKIVSNFGTPQIIANILGFIILAVILEIIFRIFFSFIIKKIQAETKLINLTFINYLNRFLGSILGIISGLILVSILLTCFIILPISPIIKNTISASFFGKNLIPNIENLDNYLASKSPDNTSSLLFLTVNPDEATVQKLGFTYSNPTENINDEKIMFKLLNDQRAKYGKPPLILDNNLTQVGLGHGKDMLANGYFSHNDLNGRSFNERFSDNFITFTYAGENLAFAPNVYVAMSGLMASPGHKANILSTNFNKVGIAVLTAGTYGEMFVQDFTD